MFIFSCYDLSICPNFWMREKTRRSEHNKGTISINDMFLQRLYEKVRKHKRREGFSFLGCSLTGYGNRLLVENTSKNGGGVENGSKNYKTLPPSHQPN